MMKEILDNSRSKMQKAIDTFSEHLETIRTGRANAGMLAGVEADYYGCPTPINQISSITVVEGRQLVVKPYDSSSLKAIEHAINKSDLGLNPQNDGSVIRINVPAPTEETRKELCKKVSKLSEEAKIAVRNLRRDANEAAKKDETLTEDAEKECLEKIQKLTDEMCIRDRPAA